MGRQKFDEILRDEIQIFILKRAKVSVHTANNELRCLRALFNFGIRSGWVSNNPTRNISFLPVEKKVKYIPPKEDVLKVIMAAGPDIQDYLQVIRETMATGPVASWRLEPNRAATMGGSSDAYRP